MITWKPMLDYCTITSYLPDTNKRILAELMDGMEIREVGFNGYKGIQMGGPNGGVIVAEGSNNAGGLMSGQVFKHWIAKFSGEMAERASDFINLETDRIRRLDVQITLPTIHADYLSSLEWKLRQGNKFNPGKGKRKNVVMIRSDTVTLYYGSRESELFWRCYDKTDESGQWYIRWEWQLQRDVAHHYMTELMAERTTRGGIFLTLLGEWDSQYDDFVLPYVATCKGEHAPKFVRTTERSTMDWLESLTPTVERMLNSHQHGNRMRNLLDQWDGKRGRFDKLHGSGTIAAAISPNISI